MLEKEYLYFNRVDKYKDFNLADARDSDQPENHREIHKKSSFENYPKHKFDKYYDSVRTRTYACCFSVENFEYIWNSYSSGDANAVCLVFNSSKLIELLNKTFSNSKIILANGVINNFFNINYGLVTYGNLEKDSLAEVTLSNMLT